MKNYDITTPHFSANHLAIRITYLKSKIKHLPTGHTFIRNGSEYVRVMSDPSSPNSSYDRSAKTEDGKKLIRLITLRKQLKHQLTISMNDWKKYYGGAVVPRYYHPSREIPMFMDSSYYQKAVPCSNSRKYDSIYTYNGVNLRSRFELLTAEAIDELGYEFKYEVSISSYGVVYYLDFLIFIPEKNRSIGIECAGMFGDPKYMQSSCSKLYSYALIDLVPDRDVFFIWGGQNWLPSIDEIKRTLIFAIETC